MAHQSKITPTQLWPHISNPQDAFKLKKHHSLAEAFLNAAYGHASLGDPQGRPSGRPIDRAVSIMEVHRRRNAKSRAWVVQELCTSAASPRTQPRDRIVTDGRGVRVVRPNRCATAEIYSLLVEARRRFHQTLHAILLQSIHAKQGVLHELRRALSPDWSIVQLVWWRMNSSITGRVSRRSLSLVLCSSS